MVENRRRRGRERDRVRRAAQTASERQATLQRKGTRERERNPLRRTRLQRTSINQREALTVETPAERETRLQRMRDRL